MPTKEEISKKAKEIHSNVGMQIQSQRLNPNMYQEILNRHLIGIIAELELRIKTLEAQQFESHGSIGG